MSVPFVPFINGIETVMEFVLNAQRFLNIFNTVFPTVPAIADLTNLNTDFHSFWTNHLKAHIGHDTFLSSLKSTDMSANNAPSVVTVLSTPEAGSVSQPTYPNSACIVITHRTNSRGRSYRGRTYVSGVPLTSFDSGNQLTLARLAEFLTDFGWLLTPANLHGSVWSVFSRRTGNTWRGTGLSTPITAVSGDVWTDSQRRRLTGRGM